jgi:hypothetical protein
MRFTFPAQPIYLLSKQDMNPKIYKKLMQGIFLSVLVGLQSNFEHKTEIIKQVTVGFLKELIAFLNLDRLGFPINSFLFMSLNPIGVDANWVKNMNSYSIKNKISA